MQVDTEPTGRGCVYCGGNVMKESKTKPIDPKNQPIGPNAPEQWLKKEVIVTYYCESCKLSYHDLPPETEPFDYPA